MTTWVSYQKGKTSLDLNEARDGGVLGCSGISCTIMQTICTSLQADNHTNTSSLNFYRPDTQPTVSKYRRHNYFEERLLIAYKCRVAWLLLGGAGTGGFPAAGAERGDSASRPGTASHRHAGGGSRRIVRRLQPGRPRHVLVALHAAAPRQVHRGQFATAAVTVICTLLVPSLQQSINMKIESHKVNQSINLLFEITHHTMR